MLSKLFSALLTFASIFCLLIFLVVDILVIAPIVTFLLCFPFCKKRPQPDCGGLRFALTDRTGIRGYFLIVKWILLNFPRWIDHVFGQKTKIDEMEKKLISGEIPVVFIIGHARSGTTNLHHCLLRCIGGAKCTRLLEMGESHILNHVAKHVVWLVQLLIGDRDVSNHPIGPFEPIEESFRIAWFGKGLVQFAACLPSTWNFQDRIRKISDINANDIAYVRRHIAQYMVVEGVPKIYIGCFLESFDQNLLLDAFGNCKLICMVRDPQKSSFSLMNLFSALWGQDPSRMQAENFFQVYSTPHYERMLKMATEKNDRVFMVKFDNWIQNTKQEFQKLLVWLNLKGSFTPQEKQERHQNKQSLQSLISKDFIQQEIGSTYVKLLELI